MNHRAILALSCALGVGSGGCFFLSDFDGLEGSGASGAGPSDGGGGTGGAGLGSIGGGGSDEGGLGGDGGNGGNGGGGGVGGIATTGGGGEGGQSMCPPPGVDYSGLVLNEMAPKGIPEDWIELRNNGAFTVPLCAVFITQGYDGITPPGGDDRFTFGEVSIGAGQYLVIHSITDFPFGLSKDTEERITLFAPDSTVIDNTEYFADVTTEFTAADSWARIPDATGPFERSVLPTKGSENDDIPDGGGGAGGGTGGAGGG